MKDLKLENIVFFPYSEGCRLEWTGAGGFGTFDFYYNDDGALCVDDELMGKEHVKNVLAQVVDEIWGNHEGQK